MRQVYKNGRIFSGATDSSLSHTCLVVNDGLVEYTGSEEDSFVQTAISQRCEVRDVGGRLLAPGFIDGYEI
jgi:predicted amidohydrolase YtcJ